jgi:Flp pilus assembly protein protease CpaA
LLISAYLDLKYRKISNETFIYFLLILLILNFFEFTIYTDNILIFLFIKSLIFIFMFISSFLLFHLKIFGGSDGKLVILIFLCHPISFLNFSALFIFYLVFILSLCTFFAISSIFNKTLRSSSLGFLVIGGNFNIPTFQKIYINMVYRFINYSELSNYKEEKFLIKSLYLIYNGENEKIQILCQSRPPLILIIIISYYILYYLIIIK